MSIRKSLSAWGAIALIALIALVTAASACLAYWLGGISVANSESGAHAGASTDATLSELKSRAEVPADLRKYTREKIATRSGRSFEQVLAHLRATITGSDFSDPLIAEALLMLRELSVDEVEHLFVSLQRDPLTGVSLPRRTAILALLCEQWGRLDHATAISRITNQSPDSHHGASIVAIVNGWSQVDPEAAVEWLREKFETFPGSRFRADSAVRAAYKQWALRDMRGALASLPFTSENGIRSGSALVGIMKILKLPELRDDLIAAIEHIPDEGLRADAINAAVSPLGFATAADWIEKVELGEEEWKSIRENLTIGWAQHDPRAAGQWMLRTGRPEERSEIIKDVVDWWTMKDVNSAAAWVTELGLGPDTDGAVASLVRAYSRESPENAFQWALHITTQKERVRSLHNALIHWRASDPEVAMKAIAESGLSEDEIQRVLQHGANSELPRHPIPLD